LLKTNTKRINGRQGRMGLFDLLNAKIKIEFPGSSNNGKYVKKEECRVTRNEIKKDLKCHIDKRLISLDNNIRSYIQGVESNFNKRVEDTHRLIETIERFILKNGG